MSSPSRNSANLRGVREAHRLLKKCFESPKPGVYAQLKMIPNPRPGHKLIEEVKETCINAGVLVLFYPLKDELHLVLTRRADRVRSHQAQISFPGGQREKGEDIRQTALRETHEELAVPPESIQILGDLSPLYIPPSNYCVYPTVGITEDTPTFCPSPEEVAEVIQVPLNHLLDPENVRKEVWSIRGIKVEVPFFLFKTHKIWGATAMMLAELLEMLRRQSGKPVGASSKIQREG